MERFPALRLILRLGRAGAAMVAAALALLIGWLLWPSLGAGAALVALLAFPVLYFLAKSYVEIVQIISEMAH